MLGLNLHVRRTTARGLVALLGVLWLWAAAAPCVMAAPYCPDMNGQPCESMDHMVSMPDCDSLQAIDCQRTDAALANRDAVPDFQIAPVLLTTVSLTVESALPRARQIDLDHPVFRLSSPPLYLQHTALLI